MKKPNYNLHYYFAKSFLNVQYLKSMLTIVLLMTISFSYSQCIIPPSGMVSWWDADDVIGTTATDIEGNNDGTLNSVVISTAGKVGNAFEFDGINDSMSTPLTINFYEDGVTFDAWVSTTSTTQGMIISDGGGGTAERGMGLFTRDNGRVALIGARGTGGTRNFLIESTTAINDGNYHLLVATWTGDTTEQGVKLYIDGVLEGSTKALSSITSGSNEIYLGGNPALGFALFEGLIDEVEIFNRVLNVCEIFDLFEADTSGKCKTPTTPTCIAPPTGMISWWDADDVSGTTATDIEGNNDGTLNSVVISTAGKVGSAFEFDGINDSMSTPLTINFYEDGVTFDAWVSTTSTSEGMVISDGGGGTAERGMGLFLRDSGRVALIGARGTGGTRNFLIESTTTINDGNYHLLVATWTGDTTEQGVKLYIDGILEGSTKALSSITSGSNDVYLGGNPALGFALFEGLIDEVEIFDRALSDCEIFDLFVADTLGKCKPSLRKKSPNSSLIKDSESKLKIYPNPSNGIFSMSIEPTKGTVNIYVIDNLGRIVFEKEDVDQQTLEIDISDQPKGIYFVKSVVNNKEKVSKVINQ